MDWMREAQEELRGYKAREYSITGLKEEIAELQTEMERMGGGSEGAPVRGGGNAYDNRQINLIVRKQKLKDALKNAEAAASRVRKALGFLEEDERRILELFYISPERDCVRKLCAEMHVEQATLYRLRERALRRYTLARYGCLEG